MSRVFLLILGFGIHFNAFCECAKVAVVIGSAKSPSNILVNPGREIPAGTKIQTQPNSFVKLILKDGSIVDVGPSSLFTVSSCEVNNQVLNLNLELELGKVRANVIKNEKVGKRELNLKTPTSLLGVRGTEFFVSWEKDASGNVQEQISVSHGQVEVRSLFDQRAGLMTLSQGTELKAEGRVEKTKSGVQVKEGSAAIDQFTATEQKTIEINTKVEQNPLEAKVELKKNGEGSIRNEERQQNNEGFVVGALSTEDNSQTSSGNTSQGQRQNNRTSNGPGNSSGSQNPRPPVISQVDDTSTSSGNTSQGQRQPNQASNGPGNSSRSQNPRQPVISQVDDTSTSSGNTNHGPGNSNRPHNPRQQVVASAETPTTSRGPSSQPSSSRTPASASTVEISVPRHGNRPQPTPIFNFDDIDGSLPNDQQSDAPLAPPVGIVPPPLVSGVTGAPNGANNIGFISVQGIWGAKKQ